MALVKCPVCNGGEIEPVRCGRMFFCPCCDGEGEIEESLLKQKGINTESYNQSEEVKPEKLQAPGWITQVLHKPNKSR